jgi:hypothetical protein
MKNEAYFAGKINGVSALRQMERSQENSDRILKKGVDVFSEAQSKYTKEEVMQECENFGNLLACFNPLFSHIRGTEKATLPSDEDIQELQTLIAQMRKWWDKCGITTLQPNWQTIFDGRLTNQF